MIGPKAESSFRGSGWLNFNSIGQEEAVEFCKDVRRGKGAKKSLSRTTDSNVISWLTKVDPIYQLEFWIVYQKSVNPVTDLLSILQFDCNRTGP